MFFHDTFHDVIRSDLAEYGRIGRYYAEQSMLVGSRERFGLGHDPL